MCTFINRSADQSLVPSSSSHRSYSQLRHKKTSRPKMDRFCVNAIKLRADFIHRATDAPKQTICVSVNTTVETSSIFYWTEHCLGFHRLDFFSRGSFSFTNAFIWSHETQKHDHWDHSVSLKVLFTDDTCFFLNDQQLWCQNKKIHE